ncbi:MAG: bacteriohemerythrin [Bacteroidales bacterium]|jgi:hemerythrin|nr:bacteriohemerythrin [Bacteroidales bacterium]
MKLNKIEWSQELSIGNDNIDLDHRRLLLTFNKLVDLINTDKDREDFAGILNEMTDYAFSHFKKEEDYMQEFGFPDFAGHKKEHEAYIYKVSTYSLNLLGIHAPEPQEVLAFLEKWWQNHILQSDKIYEQYKNQVQSEARYIPF